MDPEQTNLQSGVSRGKLPKFLTTVTPLSKILALIIFITFPFVGFYFGIKYQKQLPQASNPAEKSVKSTAVSQNDLLNDIKKLNSEIIVSDWKTKYAVYIRRKDTAIDYQPFGSNSGSLFVSHDLVLLNLESGERNIYEFSQDIIPTSMVEFLKEVTSEGGSHYSLFPQLLRWSPFTENVFWGRLNIHSNGDPPINDEVGFFKFDIQNSRIDKFTLPTHGLFGTVIENTNAEKILYECFGNGLSLYEYDLKSGKDKLIISYPKDVFDKYCASPIEYTNTSYFYGTCGRDRGLKAQWEETGISYFDFITQKRVNLNLE